MTLWRRLAFVGILLAPAAAAGADLGHSVWNSLLETYVTEDSRVDYARLKAETVEELDAYLAQLAAPWPEEMTPQARKAALINAYNALAIRWIVSHYPVESIWKTPEPFTVERHRLDGENVSLDEIEERLRATRDPRIHAVLVCAARSCPPLRREAYVAERLDEQLDDNTRRWLADPRLNEFDPGLKTARVSPLFKWYSADFAAAGGVRAFLARYAPPEAQECLQNPDVRIEYKDYHWGLNDDSPLGAEYSELELYWDGLRHSSIPDAAKKWLRRARGGSRGFRPAAWGLLAAVLGFGAYWTFRKLRAHPRQTGVE